MVLPEAALTGSETSPEAALTGNDVTGSHVCRSDRVRNGSRAFLLLYSSTKCMTRSSMTTGCDITTPKEFPWKGRVRVCATGSCAISALVGSFHRK